jgi:hypothetical protein
VIFHYLRLRWRSLPLFAQSPSRVVAGRIHAASTSSMLLSRTRSRASSRGSPAIIMESYLVPR